MEVNLTLFLEKRQGALIRAWAFIMIKTAGSSFKKDLSTKFYTEE